MSLECEEKMDFVGTLGPKEGFSSSLDFLFLPLSEIGCLRSWQPGNTRQKQYTKFAL